MVEVTVDAAVTVNRQALPDFANPISQLSAGEAVALTRLRLVYQRNFGKAMGLLDLSWSLKLEYMEYD
jgi:hypothetical protein